MTVAADLSVSRGLLAKKNKDRLVTLLEALGMPTVLPVAPDLIVDAIDKDKKRSGDDLFFVFLEDIGRAKVQKIPLAELYGSLTTLDHR